MQIKVKDRIIYAIDEGIEKPIGTLLESASEFEEKIIECGSEIIPAVENFMAEVNSGKFKPRALVKEFEKILFKYAI